ncbi:MAG: MBL fold metallo-hydrolase, partial [Novosphingobium sp.]|uniref:MBL fold metallo-hydrolase n=1 Tax=Novosphingobium sp. TaxID=1874826 RepID=UPI0032BCECDC
MPFIDDDIVSMRPDAGKPVQLFWGDEVKVLAQDASTIRVRAIGRGNPALEGTISAKVKLRDKALLRLSMIDVQQGDGLILQSPGGKVIFIDGGDNQLFARHAAARFPGTTEQKPLKVDLMLVTHGDADHFDGLNELRKSETNSNPAKRIFVAPQRYYHNGIAKRPGKLAGIKRKDVEMLGQTEKLGQATYVTGLVEDPAALPPAELNEPFTAWMETLAAWEPRSLAAWGQPIERRRLDQTRGQAFDFLRSEGVEVDLYGPITEDVNGKPGLRFLASPPDDANLMLGTHGAGRGSGLSASHTINGHSVAFRLRYGNVRFLFTG